MQCQDAVTKTDLEQARRFVECLTGSADTPVTFQTFPDGPDTTDSERRTLTRIMHGTVADNASELTRLNELGAGVFMVVNETDLKGRKAENVTRVRALFVDFDHTDARPLELVNALRPEPHLIVESSAGRAHAYWRVSDCELSKFKAIQEQLATKLGGDIKVKDLPRVMRVPGFWHKKGEPILTRIVTTSDLFAYTLSEVETGLLQQGDVPSQRGQGHSVANPTVRLNNSRKEASAAEAGRIKSFNRQEALKGANEGSRDDTLFRLAWSCRGKGYGYEESKILVLAAAAGCNPPFPEAEALEKLDRVWNYSDSDAPEKLTELGNAKRFVAQHGANFRWVVEFKKWLHWNGQRWLLDETEEVMRSAKETSMSIYGEVGGQNDSKVSDAIARHASKSQTLRMLKAMIELARSEPGIPISQKHLDADPMLLGVANGVINLATGELRPAARDDYITKQADVFYDPDARCPTWERFLAKITGGNSDLVRFLQRAVGYSLTGKTLEQCLLFLYGMGSNGKSTFLGVLADLLADYAAQCSPETLMVKSKEGGVNNDIARLRGTRLVSSVEAEEGKQLAEALVKQLTGDDTVTARFLFQEHFEYRPQFKIWFATNHKPIIRGDDVAIWRRIRLIPFTVTIRDNEKDKSLPKKLAAERPGILNWAIKGCLAWQKDGLKPPAAVIEATEDYKSEMDVFGAWLAECCVVGPVHEEFSRRLYDNYRQWCSNVGRYALSEVKFALKLTERGFYKQRAAKGVVYHGVALSLP